MANPNLLVRTQQLNEEGEKTILTRAESERKLELEAARVVRGANLTENEYGVPLFGDFFFFITGFHGFHVFTGVLINIIIFFNILWVLMSAEEIMKWLKRLVCTGTL
jgi:cytochrome c oxidase subunit III